MHRDSQVSMSRSMFKEQSCRWPSHGLPCLPEQNPRCLWGGQWESVIREKATFALEGRLWDSATDLVHTTLPAEAFL